ncbi:MAG: hypothetical protein K9N51_12625 [Candidatus Pacebacteria bacterium]|nr:hypothetical protein [Candidatus Paceibacterota bacterium]
MNDVLRAYQLQDRWFAVDNDVYYTAAESGGMKVIVTVTDDDDKTDSQAITVTVTPVDETFIGVHALAEVAGGTTVVGTLQSEPGQDASVDYTLEGVYDNDKFQINGNNVEFNDGATDATLGAEYYVNVRATGSDNPGDTNTMLIKVTVVAVGTSSTGTIFIFR